MEKKKIEAKIIADSRNEFGDRITSFILTFPRFILAELNTHRMFSRNSASSRAIPFEKMVKMVEEDPFIPIAWQKDHKGMQGTEYFSGTCREEFGHLDRAFAGYDQYKDKPSEHQLTEEWLEARDNAVQQAKVLNYLGVTKQLCNRLLEPFLWHTVLVTATEWDNFFELRCPFYRVLGAKTDPFNPRFDCKSKKDLEQKYGAPDIVVNARKKGENEYFAWQSLNLSQAEIHMQALAEAMWDAMNESTPKQLKAGEWHIPFGDKITEEDFEYVLGDKGQDQEEITCNLGFDVDDYESIINTGNYKWSEKYQVWLTRSMIHFDEDDFNNFKVKVATARCARLSYMTFDGELDYTKDIALHNQLLDSKHMSPFEHCARTMTASEYKNFSKLTLKSKDSPSDENTLGIMADGGTKVQRYLGWCNNFRGFIPYRYLIENEG